MMIASIGAIVTWALLAASGNAGMVICFRLLTGLFAGLVSGIAPTYCTEISTKDIRGTLGTYFQVRLTSRWTTSLPVQINFHLAVTLLTLRFRRRRADRRDRRHLRHLVDGLLP